MSTSLNTEDLLGGTIVVGHPLRSDMDFYKLSRIGLPKKALVSLTENLQLTTSAMSALLNITSRTIQRKGDSDLLDETTSEQILQIAEVFSRGNEVFGSSENFSTWVNANNKALGNKKPMELLSSRYGIQMVMDVMGRVEHGVFS